MIRMSGRMALSVIAVSISVSPFFTDELADRHVHDVGAEPFSGEFEGRLRAGRGFVEKVDRARAAQRRGLLLRLARNGARPRRRGRAAIRCRRGQIADAKQMAMREERRRGRLRHVKALL